MEYLFLFWALGPVFSKLGPTSPSPSPSPCPHPCTKQWGWSQVSRAFQELQGTQTLTQMGKGLGPLWSSVESLHPLVPLASPSPCLRVQPPPSQALASQWGLPHPPKIATPHFWSTFLMFPPLSPRH